MLIRALGNTPHVATVAGWLHAQWWEAEGWTLAATTDWLAAALGPEAPLALVAERDGEALGTATLDTDDLASRPDLTPWLASVLVAPSARNQGVASALVRAVEDQARALGHHELWLYSSEKADFYAARGWQLVGQEWAHSGPVALMRRSLR